LSKSLANTSRLLAGTDEKFLLNYKQSGEESEESEANESNEGNEDEEEAAEDAEEYIQRMRVRL